MDIQKRGPTMNKQLILDNKECFDHWLNGGKLLYKHRDAENWKAVTEQHRWGESELLYVIDDEYSIYRRALAEGKTIHISSDIKRSYYLNGVSGYLTTECDFKLPIDAYQIKPEEPEFPCYYKEKSSGIIVKFPKQSNRNCYSLKEECGIVVKGINVAQKTLGFTWRCWSTFSYPDRWEHLENYIEEPEFKAGDWIKDSYGVYVPVTKVLTNGILYTSSKGHTGILDMQYILKNNRKPWQPQPGEWCIFISKDDPTDVALGKFTGMKDGLYTSSAVSGSIWAHCEPFIGTLPSHLKDK